MTSVGLREMFEGNFADTLLLSMRGRAEGLKNQRKVKTSASAKKTLILTGVGS
jgi:hypothetical protein